MQGPYSTIFKCTPTNMITGLQIVWTIAVLMLGVGYVMWYMWTDDDSLSLPLAEKHYSRKEKTRYGYKMKHPLSSNVARRTKERWQKRREKRKARQQNRQQVHQGEDFIQIKEDNELEVCQYPCNDFTRRNCQVYSSVFARYAEYHKQVVTQQTEGRFLKYICSSRCGGYGNRIEGITVALMLAILSNRTLLIEMTYPFDINILLHPNAIQWNYTPTEINRNEQISLSDLDNMFNNWPRFSELLYDLNTDMLEVFINQGFDWYFKLFNDKLVEQFYDWFGISEKDYIVSYGCTNRYLFTYDKRVTDAIDKEMQQLQLTPGKYVSVHYRTRIMFNDALYGHNVSIDPFPYFKCGIKIADKLGNDYRVYFISDLEEVDKMVTGVYADWIVTSQVNKLHVDRFRKKLSMDSIIDGFVGVLVNIEVAAKGAAFVKAAIQMASTIAEVVEGIGQFSKCSVVEYLLDYN